MIEPEKRHFDAAMAVLNEIDKDLSDPWDCTASKLHIARALAFAEEGGRQQVMRYLESPELKQEMEEHMVNVLKSPASIEALRTAIDENGFALVSKDDLGKLVSIAEMVKRVREHPKAVVLLGAIQHAHNFSSVSSAYDYEALSELHRLAYELLAGKPMFDVNGDE